MTWSLSPPLVRATNDRPAVCRWCSNQRRSYSYTCSTTARAQATLDVFRRAPQQHTGTHGRTVALAVSIMAARDISLASISSKVSDDSLLRLVAHIGCRACLSSSPHIHGWRAGAATRPRRVPRVWVLASRRRRAWRIWTPGASLTYDGISSTSHAISVGLAHARPNYEYWVNGISKGFSLLVEMQALWGEP